MTHRSLSSNHPLIRIFMSNAVSLRRVVQQPYFKQGMIWGLASLVVLALALWFSVLRAPLGHISTSDDQPRSEIFHHLEQDYLSALAQQNTAQRFLALQAMAQDISPRADLDAPHALIIEQARAQIAVLTRHENESWAKTSRAVYNVHHNKRQIQTALSYYTRQWGVELRVNRLADIERTLLGGLGLDALTSANDEDIALPLGVSPVKASRFKSNGKVEMVGKAPIRPARVAPQTALPTPIASSGIVNVRPKRSPAPRYPSRAKQRKIDAVIVIAMDINAKGRVEKTHLISVEAPRYRKDFVRAAKQAAKRSRFSPKTINGRPVPVKAYRRTYRFNANDE